jgi:5-methylthioadenosine/S-adenosylhomocysteine deaminase
LAFAENGDSVESVLVDGKPIMWERRITTIDEENIRARTSALQPRIARAHETVNARAS